MQMSLNTWTSAGPEVFYVTMTSSVPNMSSTNTTLSIAGPAHGCMVLEEEFSPQDNPDNIIDRKTELWVSTVNSALFISLLVVVGVPGNVLSAAVFYRQGLRERINLCLWSLALVDLLVLTVTFCLSTEQLYRAFIGPASFFIKYFVGLTGFTWVSMFLSAVISSERCFCVVSPLRAQRVLSTRTLGVLISLISLLLLGGMLVIAGPKHTMACVYDPRTNTTSHIVYFTRYYQKNKKVLDLLDVFLYATALPAIFLLTIILTTSITAAKMRSAARWRQRFSTTTTIPSPASPSRRADQQREGRELGLTKMLMATSLLFVVCQFPVLLVQLAQFLVPDLRYGGRYHNLTALLWSVISVCRCLNSALNVFLYYRMGSRFRHTLRQLLPCRRVKVSTSSLHAISAGSLRSADVLAS